MRTWKGVPWNWKSFLVAFVIGGLISSFAAAAVGKKPPHNFFWTTLWIYLTIEGWKYWKWKALLPYPTFLLLTVMAGLIMESAGVDFLSGTNLIVMTSLNIGGLILFFISLIKEYTKVSNRTEAQRAPSNLTTVKQEKAELGESVDPYVSLPKCQGIADVQDISCSGSIPKAEMKLGEESVPSDEAFYEQAFNELESESKKAGLWAKVFAEAQGNESLAKANYLRIRAEQLVNGHKQALLQEEYRRQEDEKIMERERQRVQGQKR